MTILYAQPYDITAMGFPFKSFEEYQDKAAKLRNEYGRPVEEFEIQFIDGEDIDAQLFKALGVYQGDISKFFEIIDQWDEEEKIKVIIAVGEVGYSFNILKDDPNDFEVDLYQIDGLYSLAIQFVEEGLFGDIPKHLENYIDYHAIADDLGMDYTQIRINDTLYVYRMD